VGFERFPLQCQCVELSVEHELLCDSVRPVDAALPDKHGQDESGAEHNAERHLSVQTHRGFRSRRNSPRSANPTIAIQNTDSAITALVGSCVSLIAIVTARTVIGECAIICICAGPGKVR
jgi:hypothetical protein